MNLKGKVCIVTGGAQGIGLAIVKSLLSCEATVVIADINEDTANRALSLCEGNVIALTADISNVEQVRRLIDEVVHRYGHIDVLVNNAGILSTADVEDVTEEDWDRVLSVNLKGSFFASQQSIKYMKEQKSGRIVNISSLAGRNGGFETGCAYSASKAAVIGMTRNLARKLAPFGITVNAVAPGTTESELSKQFTSTAMESILRNIPMKRLGKPEEIAETVAFLASDPAAFITGAVIDINGGMFMG